MKKVLLVLILTIFLGACSSAPPARKFNEKNYKIGEEKIATTGSVFLLEEKGEITTKRKWVGLLYSEDGWEYTEVFSPDFIKKELIYSGKMGDNIVINYRVFRDNRSIPTMFQTINYDLSQSDTIHFQNYQIKIISCNNNFIKYSVLND